MAITELFDPKQILDEFRNTGSSKFPDNAFQMAVVNKKTVIPLFIRELERVVQDCENNSFSADPLAFFALGFLVAFQVTEAAEVCAKIATHSHQIYDDNLVHLCTQYLWQILANTCSNRIDLIKALIENQRLTPKTRAQAINSLICLYLNAKISRDELVSYFDKLLKQRNEGPSFYWSSLLTAQMMLCYNEQTQKLIQNAFADNLFSEGCSLSIDDIPRIFEEPRSELFMQHNVRHSYSNTDFLETMKRIFNKENDKNEENPIGALYDELAKLQPKDYKRQVDFERKIINYAGDNLYLEKGYPCYCASGKLYENCCEKIDAVLPQKIQDLSTYFAKIHGNSEFLIPLDEIKQIDPKDVQIAFEIFRKPSSNQTETLDYFANEYCRLPYFLTQIARAFLAIQKKQKKEEIQDFIENEYPDFLPRITLIAFMILDSNDKEGFRELFGESQYLTDLYPSRTCFSASEAIKFHHAWLYYYYTASDFSRAIIHYTILEKIEKQYGFKDQPYSFDVVKEKFDLLRMARRLQVLDIRSRINLSALSVTC